MPEATRGRRSSERRSHQFGLWSARNTTFGSGRRRTSDTRNEYHRELQNTARAIAPNGMLLHGRMCRPRFAGQAQFDTALRSVRKSVIDGPAFCSAHPMHVGRELRAARELHGLSLDELSARTKIGLERLKAIENEDVDSLPPLVYLKGFVTHTRPRLASIPSRRPSCIFTASSGMPWQSSTRRTRRTFSPKRRAQVRTTGRCVTLGDRVRGRPTGAWPLPLE